MVARLLLCDCWVVCYVIAGLLLCGRWAVAMWLLGCCYVIAGLLLCGWWAVAMWLLGCCYVIAGLSLCDFWSVLGGCWDDLSGLINVISFCFSLLDLGRFWFCGGPWSFSRVWSLLSQIKGSQRLVCHHRLLPIRPVLQTEPQRNTGIHRKHRTWWDEKIDRKDDRRLSQPLSHRRQMVSHTGDERARRNKDKRPDRLGARRPEERRRKRREDEHKSPNMLRFSFILHPIFNNSIQFLHCRLRLCASEEGPSGASTRICTDGPQIPALTHTTASQQVMNSNVRKVASWTF